MWVTKYALSEGIRLCVCEPTSFNDYVKACWPGGGRLFIKVGVNAFDNEDDANMKALQMCRRKMESLAKARRKVEDLMRQYAPKAKGSEVAS